MILVIKEDSGYMYPIKYVPLKKDSYYINDMIHFAAYVYEHKSGKKLSLQSLESMYNEFEKEL